MEKILRHLVKIIIIGSLCEKTSVLCNRQFLPQLPLTYYPDDDYYYRNLVPPYQDPYSVYYPDQDAPPPPPPPISYQSMNYYPPLQLFHQDENYHPPQMYPYSYPGQSQVNYNPQSTQQSAQNLLQQVNYQAVTPEAPKYTLSFEKPTEAKLQELKNLAQKSREQPKIISSSITIKEESYQPYYNDEYNKNYHEEEYSDNYSDDSSDPCSPTSPYRYFQANKRNPNRKHIRCNPHFQPNFGNTLFTLKAPITLLPSRFPPRVEELIERIQNYFSTYTQQGMLNQSTTTTLQPLTPVSSESGAALITEDSNKKNRTGENIEQTHSERTTVGAVIDMSEQATTKPEVMTTQRVNIERKEVLSTTEADVQHNKELYTDVQTTQNSNQITPCATEESPKSEEYLQQTIPTKATSQNEYSTVSNGFDQSMENSTSSQESEVQVADEKLLANSSESADIESITEGYNGASTTGQTFHHVTDNNS